MASQSSRLDSPIQRSYEIGTSRLYRYTESISSPYTSICRWCTALLPTRTGREPRYPSRCSSTVSGMSSPPSTAYMIMTSRSGVADSHRRCTHSMKDAASSRKPRRINPYTVNAASRSQLYR